MSWRVVCVSSRSKLDYKMDYLVIRINDDVKRIHLSEISVLMIESTAVSLTAYLLCELSKRKIDIVFCDDARMPYATLMPLFGSHDASLKLRQQVQWDDESKKLVWAEIIRAKISGQLSILNSAGKSEAALLRTYLSQIEPGDITNREGHAAKVYFNALFGMDFSRSSENVINASLNYGYSILLSAVAREIAASGYSTQLGLFHNNMFNKYNLASDLVEPFRPFVDKAVLLMDHAELTHDDKVTLVQLLNKEILINGRVSYMTNAIREYCKSIFDAVNEKNISLIRFPGYEL